MKQHIQDSIDIIQREATKLNAHGYDVAETFDNMRELNRAIVLESTVDLRDFPVFKKIEREPVGFSDELKDEVYERTGVKI